MATPDEMYDEASQLKEQGDLEGAVARLQEVLQIDANHVLTHSALGVYLQRLGRPEEAIEHAQTVARLEPNEAFSFTQLSVIYQRCGRIMEAEDAMARARVLSAVAVDPRAGRLLRVRQSDCKACVELTLIDRRQSTVQQQLVGARVNAHGELQRESVRNRSTLPVLERLFAGDLPSIDQPVGFRLRQVDQFDHHLTVQLDRITVRIKWLQDDVQHFRAGIGVLVQQARHQRMKLNLFQSSLRAGMLRKRYVTVV